MPWAEIITGLITALTTIAVEALRRKRRYRKLGITSKTA